MRVALVHMRHAAIGGTELILDRLSKRLAERGHGVTIVCRSHIEASHPSIRFVILRSRVIGSAWRMFAFAVAVERHVRESNYDLVVGLGKTWTHDVVRTGGGSHATFIERMRGVDPGSWRNAEWLRAWKDRLALRIERKAFAPGAFLRVIANSTLVRDDICERYGVKRDLVDIVYNGVDLERFHPRLKTQSSALRTELGAHPGDLVFLFLGKGFARKGLDRLLTAFAQLALKQPTAKLWIAGRDSTSPHYEALARSLNISGRVRFLGQRRDPEHCLAVADVHVLPTHYDSFAFSVLESLAVGTPVITTDAAGAAELLSPGIDGEVLPGTCEADELAAALERWCDRDRIIAAAAPARATAEKYGFEITMDQLALVLERVEAEKRARRA